MWSIVKVILLCNFQVIFHPFKLVHYPKLWDRVAAALNAHRHVGLPQHQTPSQLTVVGEWKKVYEVSKNKTTSRKWEIALNAFSAFFWCQKITSFPFSNLFSYTSDKTMRICSTSSSCRQPLNSIAAWSSAGIIEEKNINMQSFSFPKFWI